MIASQENIMAKISIDGDERETLIPPQVKKIDKMGRVYIDINLAGDKVVILTAPIKPGDIEKWAKIGRDS